MDIIVPILGIIIFLFFLEHDEQKKYKTCKKTGDIGESIVANKLKKLDDKFVVRNNIHMGRCQIDHLVICHDVKIVFVIETKMWGGIITGNTNDSMWKQNKNGVIKYMDNPIKQNQYHCRVVKNRYIGYEVYNVVVFVNNRNVPNSKYIVSANGLVCYINGVYNRVYNRCIMNV